jgi:hypothetical protein
MSAVSYLPISHGIGGFLPAQQLSTTGGSPRPDSLAAIDPMLTDVQLAQLLDETVWVLARWRKHRGRGPDFVRYPKGEVRYRLSTIMKFIEEHTVRH